MSPLIQTLLLTLMAGIAIPAGAALAALVNIRDADVASEFRHGVMAVGGGALLSAVALVLVPEGSADLPVPMAIFCFLGGGAVFCALDIFLSRSRSRVSQLVAMLSDFIPEAVALGASLALGANSALLLAGLMALQNIPEGFNSFVELTTSPARDRQSGATGNGMQRGKILLAFALLALLGPVCGLIGFYFLASMQSLLSMLMMFAAGGILYIVFGDIAPQAKLENHWLPPFGAVLGFGLGVAGHMWV